MWIHQVNGDCRDSCNATFPDDSSADTDGHFQWISQATFPHQRMFGQWAVNGSSSRFIWGRGHFPDQQNKNGRLLKRCGCRWHEPGWTRCDFDAPPTRLPHLAFCKMLLQQVNEGLWCYRNNHGNLPNQTNCLFVFLLLKWMIKFSNACIFKACVWSRPGACPRRPKDDKQSLSYEYSWQFSTSHRLLLCSAASGSSVFLAHAIFSPPSPPGCTSTAPFSDFCSASAWCITHWPPLAQQTGSSASKKEWKKRLLNSLKNLNV